MEDSGTPFAIQDAPVEMRVVLGTALLAIIRRGSVSPSLAALTMSEALDITAFLKSAVTSGAMFESRFNSGESACALGRGRLRWHGVPRWQRGGKHFRRPPAKPVLCFCVCVCAVERLMHYWGLDQEAPAKIPEKEPEPEWPQQGMIEYKDVWMRYRPELDPVLKGG